jgi:hypothetical protein
MQTPGGERFRRAVGLDEGGKVSLPPTTSRKYRFSLALEPAYSGLHAQNENCWFQLAAFRLGKLIA